MIHSNMALPEIHVVVQPCRDYPPPFHPLLSVRFIRDPFSPNLLPYTLHPNRSPPRLQLRQHPLCPSLPMGCIHLVSFSWKETRLVLPSSTTLNPLFSPLILLDPVQVRSPGPCPHPVPKALFQSILKHPLGRTLTVSLSSQYMINLHPPSP